MARPQKQGLDYFPLDIDFFESDKIEAISGEFGAKGELASIKLLCAIYDNGYFIVWNELAKMKLTRRMHGVSPELLEKIVQRLVKWNFFDIGLFESAQVLSSTGIQKRWREATRKRISKDSEGLKFWLLEVSGVQTIVSGGRNSTETAIPAEEITQKKLKEIKGKEIKENTIDEKGVAKSDFPPKIEIVNLGEPFPEIKKEEPPPSSAAPPSKVDRDQSGVATCQELRSNIIEYRKQHPQMYSDNMYAEFIRYWSEPNQKGVPRWKTEKQKPKGRFDLPGRLSTWNSKQSIYGSRTTQDTAGNKALRPTSIAEAEYRGTGNVRKVEI